MRTIHFGCPICFLWLALALGACSSDAGSGGSGGGGGDDGPAASPVQRVEITPGSVTFWAEGQSKALSAQVLGVDDEELDVALTWTSSEPSVVSVDSNGLLTATAALGSATITAEAEGVADSVFALVVVAQPDTVFVEDENVVGDYTRVDPDAPREPGLLYEVTLSGMAAPEVGQILLGTEEQPVGGKVTAVRTENGNIVVTLELLSIDALLVDVRIDETIDLSKVAVEFNEDVLKDYDALRLEDGSYAFTLKDQNERTPKSDASFGPLECESELMQFPLSFSALPASFYLYIDPDFLIDYQSDNGGLHKLSVKGDAKATFKVSPTLSYAIEGKAECTVELFVIPVPVGGPLALFFGGQVPVGVGFEIGGKITVANVGAELSTEVTATSEIGVECPGGGDCSLLKAFMLDGKAEYKWVLPQSANLIDNLRIETSLSAFVFSKVALGSRFFAALRFDTFDVKGGLALGANLATVAGQIDDAGYRSDYALTQVLSAGLASDAQSLFGFLSINVAGLELKVTNLLYESPKALGAKANVETFQQGDDVEFTVTLDPASLDFLLLLDVIPYNIDEIVIYRQTMSGPVEVARTTPSAGTTEVTLTWTADEAGNIEDNFYAFVDTKALDIPFTNGLLNVPFIDELELAKVQPGVDSVTSIELVSVHLSRECLIEIKEYDGFVTRSDSDRSQVDYFASMAPPPTFGSESCSYSENPNGDGGRPGGSVSSQMTFSSTNGPLSASVQMQGNATLGTVGQSRSGIDWGYVRGQFSTVHQWRITITEPHTYTISASAIGGGTDGVDYDPDDPMDYYIVDWDTLSEATISSESVVDNDPSEPTDVPMGSGVLEPGTHSVRMAMKWDPHSISTNEEEISGSPSGTTMVSLSLSPM